MVCRLVCGFLFLAGAAEPSSAPSEEPALSDRQEALARRYRDFESVLRRTADLLRKSDPGRSALLARAFADSKKRLLASELRLLTERLRSDDLGSVIKRQKAALAEMAELLDLLLSEDQERRLRDRRQRIEQRLRAVRTLTQRQRQLRVAVERAGSPEFSADGPRLAQRQAELERDAKRLLEPIDRQDDPAGESRAQREERPESAPDQPNATRKSTESDGRRRNDESDDGLERADLQAAHEAMRQARKQLQRLQREQASRAQDQAIRRLRKAIIELELVLRQLREEERKQLLASLETRFRMMLETQQAVYEGTVSIDRITKPRRTRADGQRALALARRENEIVARIGQALIVFREDGTAVAFPESARQVRSDALLVAARLAKTETGPFTQSVEQDIIASLREMVESLQRRRRESTERSEGSGSRSLPLVDHLSELKLIRSLQRRINERSRKIAEVSTSGGPDFDQRRSALEDLAQRQDRVYRITREIALESDQ